MATTPFQRPSPLPFRLPVQASCGAVWAWPADDPSNNVTNYRTISYSYVPGNAAAGAPCEIAAFFRVWPLTLPQGGASLGNMSSSTYGAEYDGVVKTMQFYIDGCKQGKSGLMRLAFHGNAGEPQRVAAHLLYSGPLA